MKLLSKEVVSQTQFTHKLKSIKKELSNEREGCWAYLNGFIKEGETSQMICWVANKLTLAISSGK